jgi:hypothetical protein
MFRLSDIWLPTICRYVACSLFALLPPRFRFPLPLPLLLHASCQEFGLVISGSYVLRGCPRIGWYSGWLISQSAGSILIDWGIVGSVQGLGSTVQGLGGQLPYINSIWSLLALSNLLTVWALQVSYHVIGGYWHGICSGAQFASAICMPCCGMNYAWSSLRHWGGEGICNKYANSWHDVCICSNRAIGWHGDCRT